MNRHDIAKALDEMGARHASNSVRPPKGRTTVLGNVSCRITTEGSPLAGAIMRNTITAGYASDGWKSDYESRRRWWLVLSIEDDDGHIVWASGQRFSNQLQAQAEWNDAVAAMRQDGDIVDEIEAQQPVLV